MQLALTFCIVALQLWAGGMLHRLRRLQPLCPAAAAPASAVAFLAAALLGPVSEELLYRGALHAVVLNRVPPSLRVFTVFLPALLFAAAHMSASSTPSALLHHFAFGCCAAARALAADSTWHAVFMHAANNFAVACVPGAAAAASLRTASLAPATAAYAACASADLLRLSKIWRAANT